MAGLLEISAAAAPRSRRKTFRARRPTNLRPLKLAGLAFLLVIALFSGVMWRERAFKLNRPFLPTTLTPHGGGGGAVGLRGGRAGGGAALGGPLGRRVSVGVGSAAAPAAGAPGAAGSSSFKLLADRRGWLAELLPSGFPGAGLSHLVSVEPGAVRGNHAHPAKAEVIVLFGGRALLRTRCAGEASYAEVAAGEVGADGGGLWRFVVPAGCAHAVKNVGPRTMFLLSYTDRPSSDGDTVRGAANRLFPTT